MRQLPVITADLTEGPVFYYFSEFLNFCHYESHNLTTLNYLRTSLDKFKNEVERVFVQDTRLKDCRFATPKYHILEHYAEQIQMFGSLLNGDTDSTERIHVLVKQAYKLTNKKGEHNLLPPLM